MPMTDVQKDFLNQLNAEINSIPYVSLPAVGEGYDVWKDQPDTGTWECRDYVLLKKERLQAAGYRREDLTVVLCYTETNEYHAVLAVEASGETWIMDSRVQPVYRWDQPVYPYRWVWRQIAGSEEFADVSAA